jgi:ribosomal protein L29
MFDSKYKLIKTTMYRDIKTEELYLRINELFDEVVTLRVKIATRDEQVSGEISEVVQENTKLRERLKEANHEILARGQRIIDLQEQIERMDKEAGR